MTRRMLATAVLILMLFSAALASAVTVDDLEKLAKNKVEDSIIESMLAMSPQRVEMGSSDWIRLGNAGLSSRILKLLVEGYSSPMKEIDVDDIIKMRDGGLSSELINSLILAESRSQLAAREKSETGGRLLLQNKTNRSFNIVWEEEERLLRVSEDPLDSSLSLPARDIRYIEIPKEDGFMLLWAPSGEVVSLPNLSFGSARLSFTETMLHDHSTLRLHIYRGQHELSAAELQVIPVTKGAKKPFDVFADYDLEYGRYMESQDDSDHDLIHWVNQKLDNSPRTWRHKYYDSYFPIRPKRPYFNPYLDNPSFWTYDSGSGTTTWYYERNATSQNSSGYVPYDWALGSTIPYLNGSSYRNTSPFVAPSVRLGADNNSK